MTKKIKQGGLLALVWVLLSSCNGTVSTTSTPFDPDDYSVYKITPSLVAEQEEAVHEQSVKKQISKADDVKSPQPEYEYKVGAGDIIRVKVMLSGMEVEEMARMTTGNETSKGTRVDKNGYINVPLLGEFQVAGKSLNEISAAMTKELVEKKIYRNPHIEIVMVEYSSQVINVTGEVKKPGPIYATEKAFTVSSIIKEAEGITDNADLNNSEIIKKSGERTKIDLMAILRDGDLSGDVILEPGDTLNIPTSENTRVVVLGEVLRPQLVAIKPGVKPTLAYTLGYVGGWNPITGSTSQIYVFRNKKKDASDEAAQTASAGENVKAGDVKKIESKIKLDIYQLDASNPVALAMADRFSIQPRDIVYVSPRLITEWSRFISQVLPTQLFYATGTTSTFTDWKSGP